MKPRHLLPALLRALLLLFPLLAHSGETLAINADEARDHLGQSVVVKGLVAQVSVEGKAVFLDFGATYPEFTAVFFNFRLFSHLSNFKGRTVSVTGTIIDFQGKPAIIISNLAQIAAIDERPVRTLSLDEVVALAGRGEVNERVYLRGEFRVTASGTNRAVLRDARRSNEESPRVVVTYPPDDLPPKEGERFVRDASHPYQVSHVRRGSDGVITIYVREIFATEGHDEQYFNKEQYFK